MADKDLDLDELHQAVNQLMQKPAKKSAAKKPSTDEPKPVTKAVAIEDSHKIEVRRPLPNIAVSRPRGRTMDVIGPKAAPKADPPSAAVKRQAAVVMPTRPVEPAPIERPKADAPKDRSAIGMDQTAAQSLAVNYNQPSDPDEDGPAEDILASLDMQTSPTPPTTMTHQKAPVVEAKEPEPPTPPEPGHAVEPAEPSIDEHLTDDKKAEQADDTEKPAGDSDTPFVNTKVEKRPLGAYAPDKPTEDEDLNLNATGQGTKELSPEVVAVESSDQEFRADAPKFPDEDDLSDLRQMSIPKQYQESEKPPSTGERPVFDTKDYHPPIQQGKAAAHHGSHGFGWIIILVFAILLIGALGFAYFLMTGGLDLSILFS